MLNISFARANLGDIVNYVVIPLYCSSPSINQQSLTEFYRLDLTFDVMLLWEEFLWVECMPFPGTS